MHEPPIDWAWDFDVADAGYTEAPWPIWAELRERCPVARTERRGGAWMPTRYDDIAAVAHDPSHFSSVDVNVIPVPEGRALLVAPPITSDPPFHTDARRILLPFFAPRAVDALEPATRSIATELLDAIEGRDAADAAADYAQHIPVRVIARMLGIPEQDEATFTDWAFRIFQVGPTDPEVSAQAAREVLAYFEVQIEDRRRFPSDDLVSRLLEAELDGAPLSRKHVLGTCFLLLMAGIDTTWSSIGASLWHLGTHAEDRRRLVREPSLLPVAVEELLRAYAPVTMARVARDGAEIAGCPVPEGDRVLLAFPSGNRDPQHFEAAEEVVIDRQRNRHFAFGVGIHRCLGSNLARMELQVAIGEWLARFPDYEVDPDAPVEWGGVQVRGPRCVPVRLAGASPSADGGPCGTRTHI